MGYDLLGKNKIKDDRRLLKDKLFVATEEPPR